MDEIRSERRRTVSIAESAAAKIDEMLDGMFDGVNAPRPTITSFFSMLIERAYREWRDSCETGQRVIQDDPLRD